MKAKNMSNPGFLLNLSMVLILLSAIFILQPGESVGIAQGGFEGAIFDVVPDEPVLSSLPAQGTPILLTGKIYPFRTVNPATCAPVPASVGTLGVWRAWGHVAENGRLVLDHTLQLDVFNGVIELQGPSGLRLISKDATPAIRGTAGEPFTGPSEAVSVVGGVGTYRGAQGEAHVRPYCQSESDIQQPFRYDRAFCIDIQELPRRRGSNL